MRVDTQVGRAAERPADPEALAGELARLAALDLGALRLAYRNCTGRIAPTRLPRALLLRVLAYRVQADAHGDLAPEARRMLDRLARAADGGADAGPAAATAAAVPRPGAVLVREWRGRQERVTVVEGGFAWDGVCYPSLSAAALAITGTKWNGRRFFGLDRPAARPGRGGRLARAPVAGRPPPGRTAMRAAPDPTGAAP